MPANVNSAAALTAGIRNDFVGNYRVEYDGLRSRMTKVFMFDKPSDKLTEIYAYPNAAPHPRRQQRGDTVNQEGFEFVQFSVTNFDWSLRIGWHRDDRMDDQTDSLFSQAQQGGTNFGLLDERVFFQMMLNSTDASLLPTIPNAPDGGALYATTAGGAARFGATNGNLLTGSGVTNSQLVRTDFWSAIEQFRLFQDGKGQPLFQESVLDGGVTIYYGAGNMELFAEAFEAKGTFGFFTNTGAKSTSSLTLAPPITNTVLDTGQKVTLVPTQRITDNDWFIFLDGSPTKAMFSQKREALREAFANEDNSDRSRDTGEEYVQWGSRQGYGINIPYATIKVNN